jgi:hypothetical protein
MSAPLGGGIPTLLAHGQSNPHGIAVDPMNLYWTNATDAGSIAKASIDGASPTVLAPASEPWAIAVDATHVYWTNLGGGTVMKVPIRGGTPATIASGQPCPQAIAVDSTSVYWTNVGEGSGAGTVMKASKQ